MARSVVLLRGMALVAVMLCCSVGVNAVPIATVSQAEAQNVGLPIAWTAAAYPFAGSNVPAVPMMFPRLEDDLVAVVWPNTRNLTVMQASTGQLLVTSSLPSINFINFFWFNSTSGVAVFVEQLVSCGFDYANSVSVKPLWPPVAAVANSGFESAFRTNTKVLWVPLVSLVTGSLIEVAGVDMTNGQIAWQNSAYAPAPSCPAAAGGLWCTVYANNQVSFVNPLTGTVIASLTLANLATTYSAVFDGVNTYYVAFGSMQQLAVVRLTRGTSSWTASIVISHTVGMLTAATVVRVGTDGTLLVITGNLDGQLGVLDVTTGAYAALANPPANETIMSIVAVSLPDFSVRVVALLAAENAGNVTAYAATVRGNVTRGEPWQFDSAVAWTTAAGFQRTVTQTEVTPVVVPTLGAAGRPLLPFCGPSLVVASAACSYIDLVSGAIVATTMWASASGSGDSANAAAASSNVVLMATQSRIIAYKVTPTRVVAIAAEGNSFNNVYLIDNQTAFGVATGPSSTTITYFAELQNGASPLSSIALPYPVTTGGIARAAGRTVYYGIAPVMGTNSGLVFIVVEVTSSGLQVLCTQQVTAAVYAMAQVFAMGGGTGHPADVSYVTITATTSTSIVVAVWTPALSVAMLDISTLPTTEQFQSAVADSSAVYFALPSSVMAVSIPKRQVLWQRKFPVLTITAALPVIALGPTVQKQPTLAYYNAFGFYILERATGRVDVQWANPGCQGPIVVFRDSYFVVATTLNAVPASQSYLVRIGAPDIAAAAPAGVAVPREVAAGVYPLYGVPQTAQSVVISSLGVAVITGMTNVVAVNLVYGGTALWTYTAPADAGVGATFVTRDGQTILMLTISDLTGFGMLAVDAISGSVQSSVMGDKWRQVTEAPVSSSACTGALPPRYANLLFGAFDDPTFSQYPCFPLPAVNRGLWNATSPFPAATATLPSTFETTKPTPTGTVPGGTTEAPHKGENDDTLLGGVIVGAIVIAIGGTIFYCWRKRQQRRAASYAEPPMLTNSLVTRDAPKSAYAV